MTQRHLLLEDFTAHWAGNEHFHLLGRHFGPTVKAQADPAFWAVEVNAMNDRTARVAGLSQAVVMNDTDLAFHSFFEELYVSLGFGLFLLFHVFFKGFCRGLPDFPAGSARRPRLL
jgi:hypothetical protein